MEERMALTVSAQHDRKPTWLHALERRAGVEVKLERITNDTILSPAEARQFARALYRLAARVEKRHVQIENAPHAEAPPVSEGRDEERQEPQAAPPADLGANGVHILKAAR